MSLQSKIKNLKSIGGKSTSSGVLGNGGKKTNDSTSDFDADFKDSQGRALEDLLEKEATQRILEDSRFGSSTGLTTVVHLKNEFNIEGALNSDEVAVKVIEAQKRGLTVVL